MSYNINPGFKLKKVDLSATATINAGATNSQTLQPDTGKVYQLVGFEYRADDPAGSTSGTHYVILSNTNNYTSNYYWKLYCSANTGSNLIVGQYNEATGDTIAPSTTNEWQLANKGMFYASNTYPMYVLYKNNTDANQTGTRTCYIWVKEYNEVI